MVYHLIKHREVLEGAYSIVCLRLIVDKEHVLEVELCFFHTRRKMCDGGCMLQAESVKRQPSQQEELSVKCL